MNIIQISRMITEDPDILFEEYEDRPLRTTQHDNIKLYWFDGRYLDDMYDPEVSEKIEEFADELGLQLRLVYVAIFVAKRDSENSRDDVVAALWYDHDSGFHVFVDNEYRKLGLGPKLIDHAMKDWEGDYLNIQVTNPKLVRYLCHKYGLTEVHNNWITNDPERALSDDF